MRALVQMVMVMVVGFIALMVLVSVASIFLALLLPSLGVAIPDLGRDLGYGRTGAMDPVSTAFIGVLPLFGFALMLLFCLCVVAFVMRIVGREPARAKSKEAADETRLIQELYHGMSRMEKRVEALETLLLERVPNPSHPFSQEAPTRRPVAR